MEKKEQHKTYDLVVYGATPAGIACAVRCAREGLLVLLVNRSMQTGGLLSNGLSVMDTLYAGARAPIYDELRRSIHDYYRIKFGPDSPQFAASRPGHPKTYYEAHVAELLLNQMIERESGIDLRKGFEPAEVTKENACISAVKFKQAGGSEIISAQAAIFADCSYEADLAVAAGVEYRAGRESRSEFDEEYAGRIFMKRSPVWPPAHVNPRIIEDYKTLNLFHYDRWFDIVKEESTGEADKAVQAFNIRGVLTDDPQNRHIPTSPPATYDAQYMAKIWSEKPQYSQLLGPLPNKKYLWNMPELLGPQNNYPDGNWKERESIIEEHREATRGMLYYLQNDPGVDAATQEQWRKLGFAKDEFVENGHLPYEVYARETRRIKGRKVFTEKDARLAESAQRTPVHADSISITEWFLDVHPCNHEKKGDSLYEGEIYLNYVSHPGQISYQTLLPKNIDNLFVPVCLSCTHVGWGAIRLEPTWMSIAEAVAHAAVICIHKKTTPAKLDADELVRHLAMRRVMVSFFNDVALEDGESWMPAVQYLGTQGFFSSYDAHPYKALTLSLAKQWAKAAGELVVMKQVDRNQRAAAIADVDETGEEAISLETFLHLLSDELQHDSVADLIASSAQVAGMRALHQPVTRGKACHIIFSISNKNLKS